MEHLRYYPFDLSREHHHPELLLSSSCDLEKPALLRRQLRSAPALHQGRVRRLIYLDPPFNSRQDYNVLFAEKDGSQSSSQIRAFKDTWEWNLDAQRSYEYIVERGGPVADVMVAFKNFLRNTDLMAYLAMIAPRLVELRRVLKETGSPLNSCSSANNPNTHSTAATPPSKKAPQPL
jgi:hypothetical protein